MTAQPKIYLTINKKVYKSLTPQRTRSILFHRHTTKATSYRIRVVYGKAKDAWGKMEVFDNEGTYNNYADAKAMLSLFLEKELWI